MGVRRQPKRSVLISLRKEGQIESDHKNCLPSCKWRRLYQSRPNIRYWMNRPMDRSRRRICLVSWDRPKMGQWYAPDGTEEFCHKMPYTHITNKWHELLERSQKSCLARQDNKSCLLCCRKFSLSYRSASTFCFCSLYLYERLSQTYKPGILNALVPANFISAFYLKF